MHSRLSLNLEPTGQLLVVSRLRLSLELTRGYRYVRSRLSLSLAPTGRPLNRWLQAKA